MTWIFPRINSFSFRVASDGDTWEERDGGIAPLRTIKKFSKIKEMGAVVGPAYPQTTADSALRSLEEWRSSHQTKGVDEATLMQMEVLKLREKDNFLIQNKMQAFQQQRWTMRGLFFRFQPFRGALCLRSGTTALPIILRL